MKICYITDLLSPYRIEWMNMLSKSCEITAYYFDESEKTREEDWLNSIEKEFTRIKAESKIFFGIKISRDIFKKIQKEKYDIYIIDGYASLVQVQLIKKLTRQKRRVFVNVDGIDVWNRESKADRIKMKIKRGIYTSGAFFLCGSKSSAKFIIDSGASPERVFVHPFTSLHKSDIISCDDKIVLQKKYKKELGISGKKLVLAVGRFIKLKRYEVLIESWKDMPDDCWLYLIGGGEEQENYEKSVKEKGIKNIKIMPYMNSKELEKFFIMADLFVHTSETETWGLVFNESMAKGCPVITTNHCVGGVELVEDGKEGYVVPVGDSQTLRERILKILEDEELRQKMSENSIKKIMSYTYENMSEIHLNIFNRFI